MIFNIDFKEAYYLALRACDANPLPTHQNNMTATFLSKIADLTKATAVDSTKTLMSDPAPYNTKLNPPLPTTETASQPEPSRLSSILNCLDSLEPLPSLPTYGTRRHTSSQLADTNMTRSTSTDSATKTNFTVSRSGYLPLLRPAPAETQKVQSCYLPFLRPAPAETQKVQSCYLPLLRPAPAETQKVHSTPTPDLLQQLSEVVTLYHHIWSAERLGTPLLDALKLYNLNLPKWYSRKVIAETWLVLGGQYWRQLCLVGEVPQHLAMQTLAHTAAIVIRQKNSRQHINSFRRSGVIMEH